MTMETHPTPVHHTQPHTNLERVRLSLGLVLGRPLVVGGLGLFRSLHSFVGLFGLGIGGGRTGLVARLRRARTLALEDSLLRLGLLGGCFLLSELGPAFVLVRGLVVSLGYVLFHHGFFGRLGGLVLAGASDFLGLLGRR